MVEPAPFLDVVTTADPGLNFQQFFDLRELLFVIAVIDYANKGANDAFKLFNVEPNSAQYAELPDGFWLINLEGMCSIIANGKTQKRHCEYQGLADPRNLVGSLKSLYYKCDGVNPVVERGYKLASTSDYHAYILQGK